MKNTLLIICAIFLISASNVVDNQIVQPKIPVSVEVNYMTGFDKKGQLNKYLQNCLRRGYILKSVAASETSLYVVVEKY